METENSKQLEREKSFVYGSDDGPESTEPPAIQADSPPPLSKNDILPQFVSRAPLTTRVRPEIASALKRASLTRQLQGQEPFHVQQIMEDALETWLRTHGYIQ